MSKEASQVPSSPATPEVDLDYLLSVQAEPWFPPPVGSKRVYPGEGEAEAVLRYMGFFMRSRKEKRNFLKSFDTLRSFEAAAQRGDVEGIRRFDPNSALRGLEKLVIGKSMKVSWQGAAGLVVEPTTHAGIAAIGLWLLANRGFVTRIRICMHCKRWFYARFKHQQFCGDRETKCQWNHYHSREWRKKHRESNRKHQQKYRKRLFGKRSK
jgi:hypothetical protein